MIALITALALATVPAHPEFVPAADDFARPVSELCFPSGLRVTVVRDDRQPVVAVSTVVDRGSAQDPVGREQSAHLLEHLWFRAHTPDATVRERLEELGVTHNAYTLGDATVYMSLADVGVLPQLIDLEALRLADPLAGVTSDILEQERAIVQSESELHGVVTSEYPRFLPPGFAGNGAGVRPHSAESLAAITRDDLVEVGSSYVPSTTTIQIAGPVDSGHVQALFEASFSREQLFAQGGDCGGRAPVVNVSPPGPSSQDAVHVVRRSVDEPVALVGWSLPPAYGSAEPTMTMVTATATDHVVESLRRSRFGDAEGGCVFVPSPVSSALICAATIPSGVSGKHVVSMLTEASAPVAGSAERRRQVTRASVVSMTDILIGLDAQTPLRSDDALRDVLANHYGGSPMWYADAMVALGEVRAPDLSAFVKDWTRPEQAWSSLVLPPDTDVQRVLAGRHRDTSAPAGDLGGESDPRTATSERLAHQEPIRRSAADDLPALSAPQLAQPVTRTLGNGIRLVAVQHGNAPVSHMALVLGAAAAGESRLGVDAWAWETTSVVPYYFPRGSPQIGAEMVASRLWFDNLTTSRVIGLSGSSATLDGQMYVLRAFAETAGRARRGHRLSRRRHVRRYARQLRHDPAFVVHQAQWVHLLGKESAFAYHSGLLARRGARRGRGRIGRHMDELWRPGNATLYVVGPSDPGEVYRQADRWLATWTKGTRQPMETTVENVPVPRFSVAYEAVDDEKTDATLQLHCRMPDDTSESASDVATELLREWAFTELRESDIAAYSPTASSWRMGEVTVISMSATVDPSRASAAAIAMDEGLTWLSEGVTQADTERVARRLRASWTASFVQTSDVLDHVMQRGADVATDAASHGERLMAVGASDVHTAATWCSANATLAVVSPQAGALADSPWADILVQAKLPRGM